MQQNADCLNNHFLVGEEPINWAYITKSGKSQAPANPLALSDDPNLTGLNPDLSKDLLMNPGDKLRMHMHDTPAGYRVDINDLTTGQHGSMTASIANGFGQILFQPNAKKCHVAPVRVPPDVQLGGAARLHLGRAHHQRRRVRRDRPLRVLRCDRPDHRRMHEGRRRRPHASTRTTRTASTARQFGALIPIKGCVLDDGDFDGPSYLHDWPGSFKNPVLDRKMHRDAVPVHGADLERQAARERLVRERPGPHRARRAGQPASPSATH